MSANQTLPDIDQPQPTPPQESFANGPNVADNWDDWIFPDPDYDPNDASYDSPCPYHDPSAAGELVEARVVRPSDNAHTTEDDSDEDFSLPDPVPFIHVTEIEVEDSGSACPPAASPPTKKPNTSESVQALQTPEAEAEAHAEEHFSLPESVRAVHTTEAEAEDDTEGDANGPDPEQAITTVVEVRGHFARSPDASYTPAASPPTDEGNLRQPVQAIPSIEAETEHYSQPSDKEQKPSVAQQTRQKKRGRKARQPQRQSRPKRGSPPTYDCIRVATPPLPN